METRVVRSLEDAKAHDPGSPALVEVPGELVAPMVWLMDMLQHPDQTDVGKVVRTLLRFEGGRV